MGLIPGWASKILHATQGDQKKKLPSSLGGWECWALEGLSNLLRFSNWGDVLQPLDFESNFEFDKQRGTLLLVAQTVRSLPCNSGDPSSIPGLGRSQGEGNGKLLQYYCTRNPMDLGAWWAKAHGVARVRHHLATKPPPRRWAGMLCYQASMIT